MSHLRSSLCAAAAAIALLFLPTSARAAERPLVRFGMDLGGVDLLDEGSLNHELARTGFANLPTFDLRIGGRLGLEMDRLYLGASVYSMRGFSKNTGLSSTQVFGEVGYRILGKAPYPTLTPVLGIGFGVTDLTLGSQGDGGGPFAEALKGPGLVDLNAISMLVHTGMRVDFLRLTNLGNHTELAFTALAGIVAAPVSGSWYLSDVSGQQSTGRALTAAPRVPGTGPVLQAGLVFTF